MPDILFDGQLRQTTILLATTCFSQEPRGHANLPGGPPLPSLLKTGPEKAREVNIGRTGSAARWPTSTSARRSPVRLTANQRELVLFCPT